jgi:hypothetical protein
MFQAEELVVGGRGADPVERHVADCDVSVLQSLVADAQRVYAAGGFGLLSAAGIAASMADLKVLRGVVDACDAAIRNRARDLQPPPEPPPPGPHPPSPEPAPPADTSLVVDVSPDALDEASGVPSATGRRRERHSRVLAEFTRCADALAAGEITDAHIAALSEVLFAATAEVWAAVVREEKEILAAARRMGPVAFRRFVTQITIRVAAGLGVSPDRDLSSEIFANLWIDKDSGCGRLFASFDPASYAQISALLKKVAAKEQWNNRHLTEKQALGQALIQLLSERAAPGSHGHGAAAVVSVLIDERSLLSGAHADTICEYANGSRLSVPAAQEIACTSALIPILRNRWGVVLDVGREFRWATPAQRRAMEAMYATCFHEACEVEVTECDAHHIRYWEHGGTTDLANLLPVCQHHHRWIHANNPHIAIDQHRTVTVTMAHGSRTVHRLNRQPHRQSRRQPHRKRRDTAGLNDEDHG